MDIQAQLLQRDRTSAFVSPKIWDTAVAQSTPKIFLTSSLITMQNLFAVSHAVSTSWRSQTLWGWLGPTSPKLGMWL